MPVLPLGKLGGHLGYRAKGGAESTKEVCKTYQRGGKKLIKTDQKGVQFYLIRRILRKKRDNFYGKNILWKIKEKLSRCHISMAGGYNMNNGRAGDNNR